MSVILKVQLLAFLFATNFTATGRGDFEDEGVVLDGFQILKVVIYLAPIFSWFTFAVRSGGKLTKIGIIRANRWLLVYVGWSFLGLLYAADPVFSLKKLSAFVLPFFSLLALLHLYGIFYKRKSEYSFLKDFISASIPVSGVLVALALMFPAQGKLVVFGGYADPNAMGGYYATLLFFLWRYALLEQFPKAKVTGTKAYLSVVGCLAIGLLVYCNSRGAIFGFVGAGLAATLYGHYVFSREKFIIGASSAVILLIILYAGWDLVSEFVSRKESKEDVLTLTNRTFIWVQVLEGLTVKATAIGHGFAAITDAKYVQLEWVKVGSGHNVYLHLVATGGVVALVIVLKYVAELLHGTINALRFGRARYALPFLAIILYLMIHGILEANIGLRLSPALFAVVVVALFLVNQEKKRKLRIE